MSRLRALLLPVRRRSDTARAVLVMLALALLVFSDCVFRGRMLYQRDLSLFLSGWMDAFARSVAEGSWPVWNPYPSFGQPLLATAIAQILYPTTWLNLVLDFATYMTLFAVLHVVVAGLGARALARGLGASRWGALLTGVAWAVSGPVLSTVHMPNMYAAAAWLPWAVYYGRRSLAARRRRDGVLWGVAVALTVLAGSPEIALMSLVAVPALAADRLTRSRARARPRRALTLVALAGCLAVALSAAQWMPTLELQRRSARAAMSEHDRLYWSNHPLVLTQTVLPIPFGALPLSFSARYLLYWGREPFLDSLYLGGPLLALALAGALAGRSPHRAGLVVLVAFGALFSFGHLTPVYDAAIALAPPLRAFRFPTKSVLLLALAVALLAGLGFDAWRRGGTGRRARWLLGVALPLAGLAFAAWWLTDPGAELWRAILDRGPSGEAYERVAAFSHVRSRLRVAGVVMALVAAVAAVRGLRPRMAGVLAGLAATIGVGDLVAEARSLNPTVPRILQRYRPALLDPIARQRPNRTLVLEYLDPRVSQACLGRLSGLALRIDLPPVVGYLAGRDYPAVLGSGLWGIEGEPIDVPSLRTPATSTAAVYLQGAVASPAYPRLLRGLGFDYLVSLHEEGLRGVLVPIASQSSPFGTAFLWKVRDPLPRVYWVGRAEEGDELVTLQRLLGDDSFDPRREVLLADLRVTSPAMSVPSALGGEARVLRLKPDAIEIEVESSSDGYLVVTEAYDPGWRARVDGHPATVLRANGVFRAVQMPPGRHLVTMKYRPTSVLLGLVISLGGLVAALALARNRDRRRVS